MPVGEGQGDQVFSRRGLPPDSQCGPAGGPGAQPLAHFWFLFVRAKRNSHPGGRNLPAFGYFLHEQKVTRSGERNTPSRILKGNALWPPRGGETSPVSREIKKRSFFNFPVDNRPLFWYIN
jgi:hypothetical protein